MQFRINDRQIKRKFRQQNLSININYYEAEGREMRYLEYPAPSSQAPLILFIHGAPGSASDFMKYLTDSTLRQKAQLISVDRAGYGYSDFGKSEKALAKQAALIYPLLAEKGKSRKTLIVGHSYGGTVAARLAMDYPECCEQVILLAAALDPEHERIFWVSYPADWWGLRWAVPKALRVANDEKLSHVAELEQMRPLWKNIRQKVLLMHGEKDRLVPIENSYFAQQELSNAQVETHFEKKMNHLLIWNRYAQVKAEILRLLEE